jgi:serine/threonine protein kinase
MAFRGDQWRQVQVSFAKDTYKADFVIDKKYKVNTILGAGGFGVVLGVSDPNCKKIAIKKVTEAFDNEIDTKRLLREIRIMNHIHHINLLSLTEAYIDTLTGSVYILSEQMDTNLKQAIDKDLSKLSEKHIRYILYQILCGLKGLHACGILHRLDIPFLYLFQ